MDLKYVFLYLVMIFMGAEAMMTAGSLAHFNIFKFWSVFVITFLGIYTSDLIFYYLGLRFGEKFIKKFGKFIFLSPERFDKIKRAFDKGGFWVLFFSKFVYCFGHLTSAAAGATKMKMGKYFIYLLVSSLASVATFLSIGYFFSSFIDSITRDFKVIGLSFIGFIVVFILVEKWVVKIFSRSFIERVRVMAIEKWNGLANSNEDDSIK